MSADSSLRLSSIKVLAVAARKNAPDSAAIWDLCATVEQSEMTLKNVRERTNNLARLGRYLVNQTSPSDEVAATINAAISYLVAQLKVNFRPVWAETVTALTALAPKNAEQIWTIVWGDLSKTILADKAVMPDLGVTNPEWTTKKAAAEEDDGYDDEEHEFRCTAQTKGRTAAAHAWAENNDATKLDIAEISVSCQKYA
jgi:U3 small nucleolar RNA-associated protein 20